MGVLKALLTSLLSVVSLFIIAKVMGHKQLAQMDFFDYISGITIGSIAAELATELEEPWKPLLSLGIYGVTSLGLGLLTHRFPKTRKYINGSPTILMNAGKLYRANMKKAKLDLSEFMVLCREQGYFDLADIQTAIFEQNGKLSILPISTGRPATPRDMGLEPRATHIQTELIMDGRILHENLQRMGLELSWLEAQLRARGYQSAREVFLGLCDQDRQVVLYAFH